MYDMESKNLNSFCKNCQFKEVPKILKDKYNKFSQKIFIDECPLSDKKVVGCTTSIFQQVDWDAFIMFLIEHNLLSQQEIEELNGSITVIQGDSKMLSKTP
jgi:hypothetical protein